MNKLDYYVEGRTFEWVMTVSMLILAVQIGVWPRTVDFSAFKDLNKLMTDQFIGAFMGGIGLLRAVSLLLNGHTVYEIKIGPIIRSMMAVFCAVMWSQFAYALLQFWVQNGVPSPGLPFWIMFIFGELYVAYKAVRSAR